jgi:hypothetical protein
MKLCLISEELLKQIVSEVATHARNFPEWPNDVLVGMVFRDFKLQPVDPSVTYEENKLEGLGRVALNVIQVRESITDVGLEASGRWSV